MSDQEIRSKIKNWCVTVWIGSLAVLGSSKLDTRRLNIFIAILPIAFFWVLEGVYEMYLVRHGRHARRLESMLLGLEEMTAESLQSVSLESGFGLDSGRTKARDLLYSFFCRTDVVAFYVALLAITVIFFRLMRM